MSIFIEAFREARVKFDLSQMPAALEIRDPEKRQEFCKDYKRLVGRCGQAAMGSILNFYLVEQTIQENRGAKALPKIVILGQKNTSEIIARFVEKGLADFYLSKKPVSPTMIAYNEDDKPSLTASFYPGINTYMLKKGGIPQVLAPEANRFRYQKSKAILIPPEEIRNVFAEIDARYKILQK